MVKQDMPNNKTPWKKTWFIYFKLVQEGEKKQQDPIIRSQAED